MNIRHIVFYLSLCLGAAHLSAAPTAADVPASDVVDKAAVAKQTLFKFGETLYLVNTEAVPNLKAQLRLDDTNPQDIAAREKIREHYASLLGLSERYKQLVDPQVNADSLYYLDESMKDFKESISEYNVIPEDAPKKDTEGDLQRREDANKIMSQTNSKKTATTAAAAPAQTASDRDVKSHMASGAAVVSSQQPVVQAVPVTDAEANRWIIQTAAISDAAPAVPSLQEIEPTDFIMFTQDRRIDRTLYCIAQKIRNGQLAIHNDNIATQHGAIALYREATAELAAYKSTHQQTFLGNLQPHLLDLQAACEKAFPGSTVVIAPAVATARPAPAANGEIDRKADADNEPRLHSWSNFATGVYPVKGLIAQGKLEEAEEILNRWQNLDVIDGGMGESANRSRDRWINDWRQKIAAQRQTSTVKANKTSMVWWIAGGAVVAGGVYWVAKKIGLIGSEEKPTLKEKIA
jgi:hypothetical protein